jgi:flagellin
MSSLLTNSAAMTALQTLRTVSTNMQTTEARISTGQRVATASDNSAYWSIATSMRADNSALSAVSDSLGLSAATIDTQYTALTTVLGNEGTSGLNKLQALLVEAKTAGIDRVKIQSEITQIQQDMKNTANSATFNGVNWLSTNPNTPATVNLVSSFSRVGGTPTINTIKVTVADYTLYDAPAPANPATPFNGILNKVDAGTGVSIDNMDISALTDSALDQTALDGLIAQVVSTINVVSQSAANLGAIKNRIHNNTDFVKSLMDSLTRGIGQLVDADMNAESTRLQAFQVQQQLGVQALSIANQNSQSILSLFK